MLSHLDFIAGCHKTADASGSDKIVCNPLDYVGVLSLSRWNPLGRTFIKTKNSSLNSTVIAEVYIS